MAGFFTATSALFSAGATGGPSLLGGLSGAASLGGTLLSFGAQRQAAAAEEVRAQQQADLEAIQANEEAIERRERLIQALAQQNAMVGASGVTGQTPLQVQLTDIKEFEREEEIQSTIADVKERNIRSAGKTRGSLGKKQAGVSLLTGLGEFYEAHGR